MTIAYFDCFSGISGDMLLGALVDLGLDPEELVEDLSSLNLEDFDIKATRIMSYGLRATRVDVVVSASVLVRTYQNIRGIIEECSLPEPVKKASLGIFSTLAEAEAIVHDRPVDQVHFHEVGAVDSIVDIVGTCTGLYRLGIDRVFSSPLPLGHGMIKTAHGALPVPVPAVMEILSGVPTYGSGIPTEIVTPTGAAAVKSLAVDFGAAPLMTVRKTGYGAGSRDLGVPNLLRVVTGESLSLPGSSEEFALVISTNIDDMNPEFYDHVIERLLEAGAHDAWLTPVQMKKTRPGTVVSVLCSPGESGAVKQILVEETSTFGLRTSMVMKKTLDREVIRVGTPWGTVGVKIGREGGRVVSASPEYEDCSRIAREHDVPVKEVFRTAQWLSCNGSHRRDTTPSDGETA